MTGLLTKFIRQHSLVHVHIDQSMGKKGHNNAACWGGGGGGGGGGGVP